MKQKNRPLENKGPLPKYSSYHSLTTLLDHVYVVTDINLYRPPKPMKGDGVCRDIKRNYTFHKDIGHTTYNCADLKDEIKRLIMVGYFKEFMDEPQTANREERPRQRSSEKVCEVFTIISGLHLAKESYHAHDKYANDAKNPPPVQVHITKSPPTKQAQRKFEDIVFREADARWVHHPNIDALVIIA